VPGLKARAVGLRAPETTVDWLEPSGSKRLDRRLGLGSPHITDRADPDIEGAALRVEHQVPVLVAHDDAEDILLVNLSDAKGAGQYGEQFWLLPYREPVGGSDKFSDDKGTLD
jgi:hypothetical protein